MNIQSLAKSSSSSSSAALISDKTLRLRETVNPRSGKVERIFANLELLYPRGGRGANAEVSIDEARAASRGWLSRDWSLSHRKEKLKPRQEESAKSHAHPTSRTQKQDADEASLPQTFKEKLVIHRDEPSEPEDVPVLKLNPERARSPKLVETSSQTQTSKKIYTRTLLWFSATYMEIMKTNPCRTKLVKTKLDSPTVSKVKRKNGSSEPTMTFHTRAATDEIYGIFNQPLKAELGRAEDEDDPYQSDGYDEDDFTTTTNVTTRLSGAASDFCEGDSTYLNKSLNQEGEHSEDTQQQDSLAATSDWVDENDIEQDTSSFPSYSQAQEHENEVEDEDDLNEQMTPVKRKFPLPPEDYDPPVGLYRDPVVMAQNRLPFMTPIVERTEMSMAYSTYRHGKADLIDESSLPDSQVVTTEPISELGEPVDDETRFSVFHDDSPSKKPKTGIPLIGKKVLQSSIPLRGTTQPIVTDKQCSPVDDKLRRKILGAIVPPLSTYPGYYSHDSIGQAFVKDIEAELSKRSHNTSNRAPQPLNFEDQGVSLQIKRQLGKGGWASVYLAQDLDACPDSQRIENHREDHLVALKVEERDNSAWEFYMIRTSLQRLSNSDLYSRCAESVLEAYDVHCFKDKGFLTEQYCDQGTLLEMVNVTSERAGIHQDQDESTAMFFATELLRIVEGLHAVGVIHGDVKADNCLVRLDTTPRGDEYYTTSQYSAEGEGIWRRNGITLIDFGRGIDMTAFRKDVQFIADWETAAHECPEMREGRPWTHQIDLFGIASVLHILLFKKEMEVVSTSARPGGRPTYRIKERFKRYWEQDIWSEAFDMCLNPFSQKWAGMEREAAGPSGPPVDENTPPEATLPIVASMKMVRGKMEAWLEANSKKKGLYSKLKAIEELMSKPRAKAN